MMEELKEELIDLEKNWLIKDYGFYLRNRGKRGGGGTVMFDYGCVD
jgi:hypothetical protein